MIHDTIVALVNEMHDEADKLEDDSVKSMMEGASDRATAKHLRLYANKLTSIVADDLITTIAIKSCDDDDCTMGTFKRED